MGVHPRQARQVPRASLPGPKHAIALSPEDPHHLLRRRALPPVHLRSDLQGRVDDRVDVVPLTREWVGPALQGQELLPWGFRRWSASSRSPQTSVAPLGASSLPRGARTAYPPPNPGSAVALAGPPQNQWQFWRGPVSPDRASLPATPPGSTGSVRL